MTATDQYDAAEEPCAPGPTPDQYEAWCALNGHPLDTVGRDENGDTCAACACGAEGGTP